MSMSRRSGTPKDRATTRSGHAVTITVITTVVATAAKPHALDAIATKAAAAVATAAATTSRCTWDVDVDVTVRNVGGKGMRRRRTSAESWGGIKLI